MKLNWYWPPTPSIKMGGGGGGDQQQLTDPTFIHATNWHSNKEKIYWVKIKYDKILLKYDKILLAHNQH